MIICIIAFRNDSEKTIQYTRQVNTFATPKKDIVNAIAKNINYELEQGAEFIVIRPIIEAKWDITHG